MFNKIGFKYAINRHNFYQIITLHYKLSYLLTQVMIMSLKFYVYIETLMNIQTD